jgi:signal transduction histidine kinase
LDLGGVVDEVCGHARGRARAKEGRIEVPLDQQPEGIELVMRDSGIGIAEPDLSYRADKARSHDEGGCGLGLSIAEWIERCHRAEINAESGAGKED